MDIFKMSKIRKSLKNILKSCFADFADFISPIMKGKTKKFSRKNSPTNLKKGTIKTI